MDRQELIRGIIETEWKMFQVVNGDDQVDCQQNPDMFAGMRNAQFQVWSAEALESYAEDLRQAEQAGRNLVREKYIRMMRSTDPQGYAHFSGTLPAVTDEKQRLADAVWEIQERQTKAMRGKYPALAMISRPMDEKTEEDWASVKNYQTAELLTYSENTLQALLVRIRKLEEAGYDYTLEIERNTVLCQGFASLEEAEAWSRKQCSFARDGGVCPCDYGDIG